MENSSRAGLVTHWSNGGYRGVAMVSIETPSERAHTPN